MFVEVSFPPLTQKWMAEAGCKEEPDDPAWPGPPADSAETSHWGRLAEGANSQMAEVGQTTDYSRLTDCRLPIGHN